MRIISGKSRGLKIRSIQGLDTRPTSDRVKENIFNMLAPDLPGCSFLDLFSGTGGIGIEALSRGAEFVAFVDNSPKAIDTINYNLRSAKLSDGAMVLCMDFRLALERLSQRKYLFDVIFLDPPYHTTFVDEALESIINSGLLQNNGYVVAEVERGARFNASGFEIYKSRNYGTTTIVFVRGI